MGTFLKSCHALVQFLASKEGLEVSVKGQYVFVTQSAAKLQVVKFGVIVFHRKDVHPQSLAKQNSASI